MITRIIFIVLIAASVTTAGASSYTQDIESLCGSMAKVYPAFSIKEQQFGLSKDSLRKRCQILKDQETAKPSQTPEIFFTKIMKLIDLFHDAHIMVSTGGDPMPHHVGLVLTPHNQKILVTRNLNNGSKIEPGDEVISLDGVQPQNLHYSPIRLNRPEYENLSRVTGLTVLFPLLQPKTESIKGAFRSRSKGTVYEEKLHFRKGLPPFFPDKLTTLDFVDDNKAAIWAINSFSMRAKASILADLAKIASSPTVTKVLLDLRKNGGGTTEVGNSLLRLFFPKTEEFSFEIQFSCDDQVETAMEGNPIFVGKFKTGCNGKSSDELSELVYVDPESDADPDFEKYRSPILEKARLVALISPFSYSTTEDFSMFIKTKKRGTLLGQPSGGGGLIPFVSTKLPAINAEVFIPTFNLFYDTQAGKQSVEGVGVTPDVVCKPVLTDLIGESDTCLKRALLQ